MTTPLTGQLHSATAPEWEAASCPKSVRQTLLITNLSLCYKQWKLKENTAGTSRQMPKNHTMEVTGSFFLRFSLQKHWNTCQACSKEFPDQHHIQEKMGEILQETLMYRQTSIKLTDCF